MQEPLAPIEHGFTHFRLTLHPQRGRGAPLARARRGAGQAWLLPRRRARRRAAGADPAVAAREVAGTVGSARRHTERVRAGERRALPQRASGRHSRKVGRQQLHVIGVRAAERGQLLRRVVDPCLRRAAGG